MDKKTLTQWLKGRGGSPKIPVLLLIIGGCLMVCWGLMFAKADHEQPERYTTHLHGDDYCYMDVQYMTEPFAYSEVNGLDVSRYCYMADAEFNWICVELTDSQYRQFAEIVEWTYDFEDNSPPRTVRLVGSLKVDYDVMEFAGEFYQENLSEGEDDRHSIYTFKPGAHPDKYRAALLLIPGAGCLIASLVTAIIGGKLPRKRRARKSIADLEKSGQLQAALDDLNSSEALRLPNAREMSGANVLGDRFIFLFSEGLVIPYDKANSISLRAISAQSRTLRIHDGSGHAFPLLAESFKKAGSGDSLIDKAVEHIQQRNPGCEKI